MAFADLSDVDGGEVFVCAENVFAIKESGEGSQILSTGGAAVCVKEDVCQVRLCLVEAQKKQPALVVVVDE